MKEDKCCEFFKKGHLNEAGASLYVDRMLSGETAIIPHILLEHVENCPECKGEILELYEICKNNPDYKTTRYTFSHEREKKAIFGTKLSALWRIAALIVVIVSFTFFITVIVEKNKLKKVMITRKEMKDSAFFTGNEVPKSISKKDTVSSTGSNKPGSKIQTHVAVNQNNKHESDYIAANFVVDPDLESMIEETYRSELSLKIITPKIGQELKGNNLISFQWKGKSDKKLKLEIFNNKSGKIGEIKGFTDNKAVLNKKLQPGLYYWKLETENDLLYLGKFIIK